MLLVSSGFNLLLYGYGSKKSVVEDFLKEQATGYPSLIINGYFPSLNLKHVSSVCAVMPMLPLHTLSLGIYGKTERDVVIASQ